MNKVIFVGRICSDIEFSQTMQNVSVCRFRIAVNRNYKNKNGEYETDFFNCVAWKSNAEFIYKYFAKGQYIALFGWLKNDNYDKDGVTHYNNVINVENAEFCANKAKDLEQKSNNTIPKSNENLFLNESKEFFDISSYNDDNIPF